MGRTRPSRGQWLSLLMADVVTPDIRSRMMSGIRGADTKPELIVRRGLHARGFRFRLHDRALPGRPDLVLRKHRATIFVHGCFWHGHSCRLFKWPGSRQDFWRNKIASNVARDEMVERRLIDAGWRVMNVWECATKGPERRPIEEVLDEIVVWLKDGAERGDIRGSVAK